eukprot:UN12750
MNYGIQMQKHDGILVRVVKDAKSCISAIHQLLAHNPSFVGYDCEWKSTGRRQRERKVALIQIGYEKLIILIQIHLFRKSIPIELISFLKSVNIIKCGVGISGDAIKLKQDHNISMYGCVELNHLLENNTDNSNYCGLEMLSNTILNKKMKYKHSINHTLWENKELSKEQIYYASDDAIVAYLLFKQIIATQYNNASINKICFNKIDVCVRT